MAAAVNCPLFGPPIVVMDPGEHDTLMFTWLNSMIGSQALRVGGGVTVVQVRGGVTEVADITQVVEGGITNVPERTGLDGIPNG